MDNFLIFSGYFVLLVNLILYTYSFFLKEKANVFFTAYVVFLFVIQFTMELLYRFQIINLFLVNTYFIGQMVLLGLFYKSILGIKRQKAFVDWSLTFMLLVLAIQCLINTDQFFKFNLFAITATSLLSVVYALLHFYNMLTDDRQYYYFTIGLSFYLLVSTVLFLVGNLTLGLSDDLKYFTWRLNAFFVMVYYLFILYEWKVSFNPKKENK
ncbi:hypothetical protein ACHRVW_23040 [Flavobacterium collinsii]|mgnify:CR=1 FL=1|jgi:hypothetical protein|uniref:Uncharacterized protein n=1 Tax=Flavobacterium collinsii TaxID=1114861 RepID=A0A9W4TCW5_9FLAO|nr:hypothetical protein [Flavobacterium collinsii]GIQ58315.1 hypothetical protein Flavo103_14510 [Flavobacterium collinsii]CAA9201432.1 hypothetical protein FLACOL7796_03763 [Flavobacterium collinsii]CAI2765144.1 conserved membrane protein of unknown function [Flavobacterium collinsii]